MTVLDRILATLEKGLEAWRVFISTRQEAYDRKKDKQQEKAIQVAEEAFNDMSNLFDWVYSNLPMNDEQRKEYIKLKNVFYKRMKKFNKYD